MVSFDVISLFTSIPINLALQVVKLKLQDDHLLPDRTDISVCNIMKLLEFVLHNSFFTYKEQHYQQISGCAMGSPISATIADLVMEHIEDIAISTAPHPPNWWFRYVDDSHSSLKREYVDEFHHHLNSINAHIQFTLELEVNNQLAFLDTVTIRKNRHVQVDIHRKPTHTDQYLNYESQHPIQHKQSVVYSLLNRAEKIPSSNKRKRRERKRVFKVLRENGYPSKFIKTCAFKRKHHAPVDNNRENPTDSSSKLGFVLLPYVKGVTEKISRTLRRENIKVGYKPINTLHYKFPKPKDKLTSGQTSGVVYKIHCSNCDFTYYGHTDRALNTRIKEHKRAVMHYDKYSKIANHVEKYDHCIDFDNVSIVSKTKNYHERLFLEAWYSQKDSNSENDHIEIPDVYQSLLS